VIVEEDTTHSVNAELVPDSRPTPTPTPYDRETPTPTVSPTPTATPGVGWAEEMSVAPAGDWLDLASNGNGELSLAYYRDDAVQFVTRDGGGEWSDPQIVQGSQGAVDGANFYMRTSCDNNGDVHFSWSKPRYNTNVCWNLIAYNRWNKISNIWSDVITVIGDDIMTHCTLRPDMITLDDPPRRYVVSQFHRGIGFNYDLGNGFMDYHDVDMHACYYDQYSDTGPRIPRIATGPDGKAYILFFQYRRFGNDCQLGFSIFNPETETFSAVEVPVVHSPPHFPGFVDIAAEATGAAHIVWFVWHAGTELDQLYYSRRGPAGNWGPAELVEGGFTIYDEELYMNVMLPCVAVNTDGVVMVVYTVRNHSQQKIYYRLRYPGGAWSETTAVTSSESQGYPSLSVTDKTFFLAWKDSRGNIYFNQYYPGTEEDDDTGK